MARAHTFDRMRVQQQADSVRAAMKT